MEDQYKETHRTWNNIAQLYEDKFMHLELYNDTYQTFCDLLSSLDASILEIGCGPGNITQQLLSSNPNLKILATDISQNMIDLAKKNNPDIDTLVLDARNLKTLNRKFDGIICGFTVPYLSKEDCIEMLSECAQLLNSHGIIYISFVPGDYNESGFISGSTGKRTFFYYHSLKTIQTTLESNKMSIIKLQDKTYNKSDHQFEIHTILIAKKLEFNN